MNDGPGPDLLDALWRYRRLVAAITLGVAALATAAGLLLGRQATAETTVALKTPSATNVLAPGVQGDAALARYSSQRALFARSDQVLDAAAARLAGSSRTALRSSVTVEPSANSTAMVVRATGDSSEEAVTVVGAVVQAYREQTRAQVRERSAAALDALRSESAKLRATIRNPPSQAVALSATETLADLTRQAVTVQTDSATFADGVDFVRAATLQSASSPTLPYREMALGLLLGLGLGGTAAWLRADRNRRVTRPRQAEPLLGAPLLGTLPRLRHSGSAATGAELVRHCRDAITPVLSGGFRGALLVTSVERGAGATTVALGMGTAAAAEGLQVLLVDADPARRGLSERLGLAADTPGLVEATEQDRNPSSLYQQVEVAPGVKVTALAAGNLPEPEPTRRVRSLPSGHRPSTAWSVTAAALHRLLDATTREFDVVVLDAPAPGGEYVSSVLTGMVDGVVVVVRQHAAAEKLSEVHHVLALNRAPVVGYVYTFADERDRVAA